MSNPTCKQNHSGNKHLSPLGKTHKFLQCDGCGDITRVSDLYKSTFHKDGTITFWNGYTQTWTRQSASAISADNLASMSPADRARAIRTAASLNQ